MKLAGILALFAIVGLACLGGQSPAEDSLTEYCSMVRDGLWPDYQGVYKQACHR